MNIFLKYASLSLRLVPLAVAVVLTTPAGAAGSCQLRSPAGDIQHVIHLQFDNVHLRRDVAGVPSDLEQMPNLLSFLKNNGTLLNKHYTILISHTAGGILSTLTGLYPDRMGITVSNSYDYYNKDTGIPTFSSGFKYWTAPVAAPFDNTANMIRLGGQTTNAPWVTYTRAGCDVGNISSANMVLENNNAVFINGGPTSISAATAIGANSITVQSTTGMTAGKQITIDAGANAEQATIGSVVTATRTLNLTAALTNSHTIGATVYGPTSTDPTGDMTTIFGVNSPEWNEGKASQTAPSGTAARTLAQTDFVGIALHCAQGSSSVCANNPNARSDLLPDEPGGYNGFQALFGAKYVNPAINHGSPSVNDLNGAPIADPFGQPGFPGFDSMPAATTLGYVAQMQEAGIAITYAYISDVHDNHAGGGAYGPGEAGYVAALKSYDDAFGKFIARLAADGINTSNTLFVVTADENDHYAGQDPNAAPFNQKCDGVTVPCTYNTAPGLATGGKPAHGIFDVTNGGTLPFTAPSWPPAAANGPLVGEVGYNMKWLLGATIAGTGYDISFDSAPSFYIYGQPEAVDAADNVVWNYTLRSFELAAAGLMAFDPYLDSTKLIPIAKYLVDGPTLKALHMINADPQRTMSFTMFAQPDFYFQAFSPCPGASQGCVNDGFAWIHGDYSNDIGQTWLGLAGPGVLRMGLDDATWTDHTDIVPTMNLLLGLTADYQLDGRAITQVLTPAVAKGGNSQSFVDLGDVYKQINAPYGAFAHSLIVASTKGIKSDELSYLEMERRIQQLAAQRDELAYRMKNVLDGTTSGPIDSLIQQGRSLLQAALALGGE